MMLSFFYFLRSHGWKATLTEWLTLLEALTLGLNDASFTGFYQLCRMTLVTRESDYQRFGELFDAYFQDKPQVMPEVSPEELLEWLDRPAMWFNLDPNTPKRTREEILEMFHQRLQEQKERHSGGHHWIGTAGYTDFGHSGHSPQGIRVGGKGQHRSAFQVMEQRQFGDFRENRTLDSRNFQVAVRALRQLTAHNDAPQTELDLDGTVRRTCDRAGKLEVVYKRPRKNRTRVLLLMDSGGSMDTYASLCSALFRAVRDANCFRDLQIYYFHNCIYTELYRDPKLKEETAVETGWLLQKYAASYRVILVGDAMIAPEELWQTAGGYGSPLLPGVPLGEEWLQRIRKNWPHAVWLNPTGVGDSDRYIYKTRQIIAKIFPMYPLTVDGLRQAMRKLAAQ